MTEEKLTVEDQKELYGAINAASAAQLRDGKLLQEKMTDVKQKPVVVRMYEELQEKSTAMLVNVEPDPASKEIEDVRTFHAFFLSNIQSTLLWRNLHPWSALTERHGWQKVLAPAVQTLDCGFHWINYYPLDEKH